MFGYHNKIVQDDMKEIYNRSFDWNKLKRKTVLITGASGMLASYMTFFLTFLNEEHHFDITIYALVRNQQKAKSKFAGIDQKPYFHYAVQDVCEEIDIQENVDYIVHAAGNASPRFILSDPVGIIKANTLGMISVLEFARKSNTSKVVFTSTREVYGETKDIEHKITEEDMGRLSLNELRNCYPESKRMSEILLKSYEYQYKIPYVSARIAHTYGPGMEIENDGRVMADLVSDVVHERDIVLKSDGTAERAFCYITDAIAGLFLLLLEGESGEAYNVANETKDYMIREVAQRLISLYPEKGLSLRYEIPESQSIGYSRMGRTKLDTGKVEKLGWSPQVELDTGLQRTVDSFICEER